MKSLLEKTEKIKNEKYCFLVTHCGYVDAPLFELSSFNVCRAFDLKTILSNEFKEWMIKNGIESICHSNYQNDK